MRYADRYSLCSRRFGTKSLDVGKVSAKIFSESEWDGNDTMHDFDLDATKHQKLEERLKVMEANNKQRANSAGNNGGKWKDME